MGKSDKRQIKLQKATVSPLSGDTTAWFMTPFGENGSDLSINGVYKKDGTHKYYYYANRGNADKILVPEGSLLWNLLENEGAPLVKQLATYNWPFKWLSSVNEVKENTQSPKLKNGGSTKGAQPQVDTKTQMEQLLVLINAAGAELQQQKPGQSVQYLAQLMQDPQGMQLLDALESEVPDIRPILDEVEKVSSQFLKCGGNVKKKVKKGARGCVPCKKLMKIGGRLVNVMADCEGNIISKHAVGGRFIPKGNKGMTAEMYAMLDTSHDLNWAKNLPTTITTKKAKDGTHYYLGEDGVTLYSATAANDINGDYRWISNAIGDISKFSDDEKKKYNITSVTTAGDNPTTTYSMDGKTLGKLASLQDPYNTETTAAATQLYFDGTDWWNMHAELGTDGQYFWRKGEKAIRTDFGDDDMRSGLPASKLDGYLTATEATGAGINIDQFNKDNTNTLLGDKNYMEYQYDKHGAKRMTKKIQRQFRKDKQKAWEDAYSGETFKGNRWKTYKDRVAAAKTKKTELYKLLADAINSKWNNNISTQKQGGWLNKFEHGGVGGYSKERSYSNK